MYDLTPVHKASAIKDWKDYSGIWNDGRFLKGSKIFVCLSYSRKGLGAGREQDQYCPNKQYHTCQCPSLETKGQDFFLIQEATCNADLCNTQQWGLNLGPVDLTQTSLLFWGGGIERFRQIFFLILLLYYAYNTILSTLGFSVLMSQAMRF